MGSPNEKSDRRHRRATVPVAACAAVAALIAGGCGGGDASEFGAGAPTTARPGAEVGSLLFSQPAANGKEQLFTLHPDGTGLRQLTDGDSAFLSADWSPDGRSIAFEHDPPDESRAAVAVMDAAGTNLRELTPTGYQTAPSYTPDGRRIVFTRDPNPNDNGLWIMDADGGNLRRLTRNPFIKDGACGCDGDAHVSPDGRKVAFVRIKRDEKLQGLFSVGIDGSGLRQLLPYSADVGIRHDWSPDGTRLALTVPADPAPRQSANVVTVRPDGRDLRPVTRFTGGTRNGYMGAYSPDGKWIALRIEGDGRYRLALVRPDGTGLHEIAVSDDPQADIDWRPTR